MTRRRRILRWLDSRVPQTKRVVITADDPAWGDGFNPEPESRASAIRSLADVIEDWASDQWNEDNETFDHWLDSLTPVPVVSDAEWSDRKD